MTDRFEEVDEVKPGHRISDIGDEGYLVNRLSRHMRDKLAKNRGKLHWREPTVTDRFLYNRLLEELDELMSAPPDDVWNEAADVANFAAMLADRRVREGR